MLFETIKRNLNYLQPLAVISYMAVLYALIMPNFILKNYEILAHDGPTRFFFSFYVFVFHLLALLICYCFVRILLSDPGEPP